jgi:16S rRNA A1518/A1519 N6-dimethyltransferase RsmA/KsgA/DIM1 with predicted DNA glycosylase/AP lyase activity
MNKFLIVYSFEAIHYITDMKEIDKHLVVSALKGTPYYISADIKMNLLTASSKNRKVIMLNTELSIDDLHDLHSTNYREFVETMNTGESLN